MAKALFFTLIGALTIIAPMAFATSSAMEMDRVWTSLKVYPNYEAASQERLVAFIDSELAALSATNSGAEPDQSEKLRPFLEYAQSLFQRPNSGTFEFRAYMLAQRVLEAAYKLVPYPTTIAIDDIKPLDSAYIGVQNWDLGFWNHFEDAYAGYLGSNGTAALMVTPSTSGNRGKIYFHTVGLPEEEFHVPYTMGDNVTGMGTANAIFEASLLMTSGEFSHVVDRSSLGAFGVNGSSHLDVIPWHPIWYTAEKLELIDNKANVGVIPAEARWKHLIDAAEQRVSQYKANYNFEQARRVLFFTQISNKGLVPQIRAQDAVGETWNIKWGDEVQPDVVARRLFVALGGKYVDPAFVNGRGESELILILPEELSQTEFLANLLSSKPYYNLKPNLFSSGTIDQDFIANVLLPKLNWNSADANKWNSELIGRTYLSFRESMVEHRSTSGIRRAGALSVRGRAYQEDRGVRAMSIFQTWIGNRNVSNEEFEGLLVEESSSVGEAIWEYREAPRNLGHSLGSRLAAGELNGMKGVDFVSECKAKQNISYFVGADEYGPVYLHSRELSLCYMEPQSFVPETWRRTTQADMLWMARRILKLTHSEITSVFKATNWPGFLQRRMANRLQERRLGLARILGLPVPKFPALGRPLKLNLTVESQQSLEEIFKLPAGALTEILAATDRGTHLEMITPKPLEESCNSQKIISLLERKFYPSGLFHRRSRLVQHQEEAGCETFAAFSWDIPR